MIFIPALFDRDKNFVVLASNKGTMVFVVLSHKIGNTFIIGVQILNKLPKIFKD